jgi:Tol biopolymer transport system component
MRLLVAIVTSGAAAIVFAPLASSTFPGRTGVIAFDRPNDANVQIYTMNADGNDVRNISNNTGGDHDPRYSADGSRITFVSTRDGNHEIYVMNADGSGQTRLTSNAVADEVPAFTADGRIVFASDRDGGTKLFVMNGDGTDVRRLTNDAFDFFPAPSPRGDAVAFISNRDGDGTYDIFTTTTSGGPLKRVTDSPTADVWPMWSPNGNDIAFTRWDGSEHVLYTVHKDGSGLTRITDVPGRDELAPAWSPDGSKLVFLGCFNGDCDLIVKNADGTGPETTLVHGGAGAPDWQALPRGPQ